MLIIPALRLCTAQHMPLRGVQAASLMRERVTSALHVAVYHCISAVYHYNSAIPTFHLAFILSRL